MTGVERCCVVTGGRGFAARHLVEMLIRSGNWMVRIVDLGPTIKLEPYEDKGILGEALRLGNAQYVSGDLRDKTQVLKVCQGVEVVFHMAAPDSSINNHQLHYSVNVEGTKNVIDACIECKVKRLVYTSTIDVVFDGVHGISNGDELMPYPAKHHNYYSATKAEGEALVIKSNGKGGLLTCCIRPGCIFGPGDRLVVPSLITAARAGKSKFIIGDGNNMFDFIYVENVAYAHICAEKALASEGVVAERAAGQAYFITNKEPIKFWEFMSLILEGFGYERPRIKIPVTVMMPIAHVVEWTYRMLARYGMSVPQLTPSRIRDLTGNKTFNCSKAKDQLGYTPLVSLQILIYLDIQFMEYLSDWTSTQESHKWGILSRYGVLSDEGLKRTIASFSHLKAAHQPKREGSSKSYTYLGSGKVADTLLWKDKRQTITTVLVLIVFYCYFIVSGYTIITAISKLVMVTTIFLFVHGILPAKIFGYSIKKIPASSFHLPEERCQSLLNFAVHDLKSLCKGKEWTLFFKVFMFLSSLSFLGATSIPSIFLIDCGEDHHLVKDILYSVLLNIFDHENLTADVQYELRKNTLDESEPTESNIVCSSSTSAGTVFSHLVLLLLYCLGMPIAFLAFMVYEMKEEEIDGLVHRALSSGQKLKSDITGKFLKTSSK